MASIQVIKKAELEAEVFTEQVEATALPTVRGIENEVRSWVELHRENVRPEMTLTRLFPGRRRPLSRARGIF